LADLPDYQAWLNSPCPQILYLHGSHQVRDVAESVFYSLEDETTKLKRRANVLYFSFDRFDVRADSIRDMIATFLAQICNHHPKLGPAINRLCCQIENERGWTETDLIQFFEMFRISAEVEQTMIVINHFDECTKGSRKRFLDHITDKYYNDETPWKIVVTSHEPGALNEELSGPFCVPIEISSGELGDLAVNSFESDIQALIRSRGDLTFREKQIRDELRFTEKLDPPVRHIIIERLRVREEWPDEISTDDALRLLSLSQQGEESGETMVSVLNAVLRQYPDQNSLECILSWLLYAVRPLTIWELATIVSFSDEKEQTKVSPSFMAVDRLVEKVEKDFAGILEVDHNEVRFQHPCLHEIMVNGDPSTQNAEEKDYPWNKIKGKAHILIQSMCLDYLSRDTVQEYVRETFSVADSATFETPPFPDRTNLASYAIQAWAHHYSLSSPIPDISALSSKKDLVQTLAKAQWCLANPATRRSPCFQSLFPIFAGLGLPNVAEPLGSDDALRGLIEAASKGQKQVVEDLLGEYDFTPTEKWEVLKAASSSGSEELMNALLDKIEAKGKIPKDFEWPPVLIYRAANLSLEAFAERILSLGCPPDPDVDWRNETSMQASPLYLAACHGYTNTVRVLLKHGASMEYTSLSGRNPLHKAALEGHTETVKAILEESQINIDFTSESKFTLLYLAVLGGNHDTVKLLLEEGADPSMGIPDTYTGDDQWTPLLAATDDGFKKCIRLLLDNGANPNLPGPSGPPLHWAVIRGRVDVLDMLLEAGADPRSELLKKPLLFSAVGAELEGAGLPMLERLLELNLDVNGEDSGGVTALLVALFSYPRQDFEATSLGPTDVRRDDAVKMLLDHGADPNNRPSGGLSPLMRSVAFKQYKATEMLLEAGADPNKKLLERLSPLISAVYIPSLTRLLLKHGARPEIGSKDGWTNLTYAACQGYNETVKVLLEYGASVDTPFGAPIEYPERTGASLELCEKSELTRMTAVMFAAWQGHHEIVRVLAEAGADLQRTGGIFEDEPPILFSSGKTLSALLEFPTRINLNVTDSMQKGALHRRRTTLDDMRRIINAGADIELTDSTGNTPLGVFAGSDLKKVKLLVRRGANVNHMSPSEGSPLHQACKVGFFDSIKFLIENGADLTSVHPYDGTPLQTLCAPEATIDALQHEEMVRYLVSEYKKQDVDITTDSGIFGYLINAAAFGSSPSIINFILEQEGIKVDVKDDMGRMPIHLAACNGLPSFNAILERGGDIHAKDKQGRTPLHWAAQAGRLQVVRNIIALMEDKLDIDIIDVDGWTPLCWALRGALPLTQKESLGEPSLRLDVVKLLIEKGAKTAVAVSYKEETWTPQSIAPYHNSDTEIISLLEKDIGTTDKDGTENSDKDDAKSRAETAVKKGVRQDSAFCDYCLSVSL
jgi:ankyrin repeat protein